MGRWWLPWWFIYWVDRLDIWCWADLVTWKVHGSDFPRRNTRCVKILTHGGGLPSAPPGAPCLTCYCGYSDRAMQAREARRPSIADLGG